jgi:predicted HicB family RNase H-like nuclease
MTLMNYRDYLGSVEFDEDERIFHGKLEFIRALVSYEAGDAEALIQAFHDAVDDYLAQCKEQGVPAERPLKGSFNVRVGPDLHRRAVIAAAHAGVSLNAFTTRALEAALAGTPKEPRGVSRPDQPAGESGNAGVDLGGQDQIGAGLEA